MRCSEPFRVSRTPFTRQWINLLSRREGVHKLNLDCRKDLRKECIFTIDPATARDLDDALHCTKLDDGGRSETLIASRVVSDDVQSVVFSVCQLRFQERTKSGFTSPMSVSSLMNATLWIKSPLREPQAFIWFKR